MCISLRQSLRSSNRLTFDSLCAAFEWELAFDSLVGVRTVLRERLLAFDSLWTGLVIVTSNVYNVCELCYYRSNFQTIPLIVRTPPLFREKLLINENSNACNEFI